MTTAAEPTMRERPILFSGEMVRAILDGRKTQTRRVVLPQPNWLPEVKHTLTGLGPFAWPIGGLGQQCGAPLPLRYFVGDRLWVRESHSILDMRPDIEQPERSLPPVGTWDASVTYRADDFSRVLLCEEDEWRSSFDADHVIWRPSIHMPRWASRLLLEITAVRVERVQSISEDDARAEGLADSVGHLNTVQDRDGTNLGVSLDGDYDARNRYIDLWDSLNAKRGYGWDVNPWVWAIEFKRLET